MFRALTSMCSRKNAFEFIADPKQLPKWTHAFATVTGSRAVMRTPNGEVEIGLEVRASVEHGTNDWHMTFPNGNTAVAYSRVVDLGPDCCAYSFVLTPPPVALEQLEGTLAEQSKVLASELATLRGLLKP